jgi:isopenicillin N synthase-like dioxygenase
VIDHGIAEEDLAALEAAMRGFFALPAEEKRKTLRSRDNAWGYYDEELTKNRPDWKEVFDYGAERAADDPAVAHSDGRNRWPEALPGLKPVLLRHHAACEGVARALLRAICTSLGLAPDRLDAYFEGDSSFVRLNHYPRCDTPAAPDAGPFPASGHLGVHHHSDAGAFTLVYQDGVAGLQVEHEGRFELVEPVAGALTVNLGDMLQVWSNDCYRSPVHRVITSAERERYSAPFFFNPRYDTVCEPLLEAAQGQAPRFRPISWARFRDQRSAGDFADYGSEIQIDDFRIEPRPR